MQEKGIRARVQFEKKSGKTRLREAVVTLNHDRITVGFVEKGKKLGEEAFSLAKVKDVEISRGENGTEVRIKLEEDTTLRITPGDNPLIYDAEKVENLAHEVLTELLNGVPVLLGRDNKWETAYLKIVGKGRALVMDSTGIPVLSFATVIDGEEEVINERLAWKLTKYSPVNVSKVYLAFPNGRIRFLLLRYMLLFIPESLAYLEKLSSEFPQLRGEIKMPKVDQEEVDVMKALLSGVDPIELPEILRKDPIEVELVYDRLIRKGLLKLVGVRKIVEPSQLGIRLRETLEKGGAE